MKIYFLLSIVFLSTDYCYAEEDLAKSPVKALIVREIMKKVSNITFNTLAKVSDEKKHIVLNKIKKKLKDTAKDLVDGEKYVKIIMKQFESQAYAKNIDKDDINENTARTKDSDTRHNTDINMKDKVVLSERSGVENGIKSDNSSTNRKTFDPQTKQQIIIEIANKIESVAKSYLRSSQTLDEKKAILKKIEKRIIDSSRKKHIQIHNQHNELKAYTELIREGLELSMKRLFKKSKTRRMNVAESEETPIINDVGINETSATNIKLINQYKTFFSEVLSDSSIDPRCTEVVENICLRIDSLHKLSCGDGKIIELEKLCDGVFDCWNEADELNCTQKVVDKIQQSMKLMSDIEESITTKCLKSIVDNTMFSQHHSMLLNMLKSELHLLQNQDFPKEIEVIATGMKEDEDIKFSKKKIGGASTIVTLLSSALDINLCLPSERSSKVQTLSQLSRRSMKSQFMNNNVEEIWSPKSCICNRDVCKALNCDARCKRICWQKFRLNRWKCHSVIEEASISLDLICDGKYDCFDESDESSCSGGSKLKKFEANNIFIELLDILSLKALSVEYENSRNKISALAGLVRQIQKLTSNSNEDLHGIRILRDEYFKMLVHVYSDMMRESNLDELDQAYEFLVLLNEKMVEALKRTQTGNENVVPPAGCHCSNGSCVQVRCPQKCHTTCLIEPLLTTYSCNMSNLTVPIKAVCNGKNDCPNEQDEKDCKKDICRSHHLLLLRNNLQRVRLTLQGSSLGEVLDNWKGKVMTTLKIAETRERPNHKVLEDTINNILHDLVSTYGSMEERRKNGGERLMNEFIYVSNIVKEGLKSCRN